MKKLILILLCFVALNSSCTSHHKIKLAYDFDNVFDRKGRVEGYAIDEGKKKVINFSKANSFYEFLYNSPKGKIDSIIKSNPDWEFIFYCSGQPKDTADIVKFLDEFDCDFPVIMDYTNEFGKMNFPAPADEMGIIGYICDKNNKIYGLGPMGDTRSTFDGEFRNVKRMLK